MIQVDLRSRTPIYEQLYENVRRLILEGQLAEDEKMPSVRELASILTINPNTIQKAYKTLEKDGYLYSVSGKGNFVKGLGVDVIKQGQTDALAAITSAVQEAKLLDVPKDQVNRTIDAVYSKEEQL